MDRKVDKSVHMLRCHNENGLQSSAYMRECIANIYFSLLQVDTTLNTKPLLVIVLFVILWIFKSL